jgi:prevent-host-death family protein
VALKFQHDIEPAEALGTRGEKLVSQVRRRRRPLILTRKGKPAAVLIDAESYALLRDAALLAEFAALAGRARKARR